MVTILEQFHSIGYIHIDIKPDNICVANGPNDTNKFPEIKLIDFGVCQPYIKNPNNFKEPINDDEHIDFRMQPQKGNLIFASPNSVMDMVLSRRDDMISLFYLLLHLQTGELPFYKPNINQSELK